MLTFGKIVKFYQNGMVLFEGRNGSKIVVDQVFPEVATFKGLSIGSTIAFPTDLEGRVLKIFGNGEVYYEVEKEKPTYSLYSAKMEYNRNEYKLSCGRSYGALEPLSGKTTNEEAYCSQLLANFYSIVALPSSDSGLLAYKNEISAQTWVLKSNHTFSGRMERYQSYVETSFGKYLNKAVNVLPYTEDIIPDPNYNIRTYKCLEGVECIKYDPNFFTPENCERLRVQAQTAGQDAFSALGAYCGSGELIIPKQIVWPKTNKTVLIYSTSNNYMENTACYIKAEDIGDERLCSFKLY